MYKLVCTACGAEYPRGPPERYSCDCGGVLLVEWDKVVWKPSGEGVWRYKSLIPFTGNPVTMGEGGTNLVHSRELFKNYHVRDLRFKTEGDNPTDSFKDRGTTVCVSRALQQGYKSVSVASTGNMGASVAAYAAFADLEARVFVPADTPNEKLAQIMAVGGKLHKIEGTFKDCVKKAVEDSKKGSYLCETGLNPYYLEGEKTLGFELFEDMRVPDKIVVPTGTGGLITSIYKAFKELKKAGKAKRLPEMVAVQAKNCSPIVDAWKKGTENVREPKKAKTIAGAIMVKSPFNGATAVRAITDSGGCAVAVTDSEIRHAILELGKEGVFAEPASAAALAAMHHLDCKNERVALVITGHGLKDPAAFRGQASASRSK